MFVEHAMAGASDSPGNALFTATAGTCQVGSSPGVLHWRWMVSQHIDSYIPRGGGPAWWRVAGEVRRIVQLAEPATCYTATELLGPLARLAMFADAEGRTPDAATWLSPEMIERFIAVGCPKASQATCANYRARLRRLRTALLGPDVATGAPPRLSGAVVSTPYTQAELGMLWSWAYSRPTQAQRHGCKTLLALGRGCGLDSAEAQLVRRQDVQLTGNNGPVQVAVSGPRARGVVCRRSWEPVLRELVAGGGEGWLFRPGARRTKNAVTNFLDRTAPDHGVPRLVMARLRASWLVELLETEVPISVVVAAAGVDSLHALSRLMPHVTPADPVHAVEALRGRQ
jgi:hypothetical protein